MDENIQKLSTQTEIVNAEREEKRSKFLTKLLEVDLATHLFVFVALIVIIGMYIVVPQIAGMLRNIDSKTSQSVVDFEDEELAQNIEQLTNEVVRPVYANEAEVDPKQIFSYPPSKVTLAFSGEPKKEVYGFFPYWMLPSYNEISLNSLTAIGIFALDVDGKGNIQTVGPDGKASPGWTMWNDTKLNSFITKAKKRRIKVELVIKSFSNTNMESLVLSDDAQKTFIANTLHLVQSKGLDGVNLDFEYVGTPSKAVREGFTRMIHNLRFEMKRQYPHLTLTIDSYITEASIQRLIDLQALNESVDAFIIMGYDFHTPNGEPGPIAPMEGGGYSIVGFLQSYLEKVPSEKLILAIAYYGYDWASPSTTRARVLPYAQLAVESKKYVLGWDDAAQSPYYKYTESGQNRIVYFENSRSLGVKYDYVNRKNFKGIGIWALGYDGLNADLRTLILEKFSKVLTTN